MHALLEPAVPLMMSMLWMLLLYHPTMKLYKLVSSSGATIVDPLVFLAQLQQETDDDDITSLFQNEHDKHTLENQSTTTTSSLQQQQQQHETLQREMTARQEVQMIDRLINPRGRKIKSYLGNNGPNLSAVSIVPRND
jgi:hypothetical protein